MFFHFEPQPNLNAFTRMSFTSNVPSRSPHPITGVRMIHTQSSFTKKSLLDLEHHQSDTRAQVVAKMRQNRRYIRHVGILFKIARKIEMGGGLHESTEILRTQPRIADNGRPIDPLIIIRLFWSKTDKTASIRFFREVEFTHWCNPHPSNKREETIEVIPANRWRLAEWMRIVDQHAEFWESVLNRIEL